MDSTAWCFGKCCTRKRRISIQSEWRKTMSKILLLFFEAFFRELVELVELRTGIVRIASSLWRSKFKQTTARTENAWNRSGSCQQTIGIIWMGMDMNKKTKEEQNEWNACPFHVISATIFSSFFFFFIFEFILWINNRFLLSCALLFFPFIRMVVVRYGGTLADAVLNFVMRLTAVAAFFNGFWMSMEEWYCLPVPIKNRRREDDKRCRWWCVLLECGSDYNYTASSWSSSSVTFMIPREINIKFLQTQLGTRNVRCVSIWMPSTSFVLPSSSSILQTPGIQHFLFTNSGSAAIAAKMRRKD